MTTMTLLTIANDGQKITATNYWASEHAKRGMLYLSSNAGALRLLVPRSAEEYLNEMKTTRGVTIEPSMQSPGCADVVFEDGSQAPFFVTLAPPQTDRPLQPVRQLTQARGVPLHVWTEAGCQLRLLAVIIASWPNLTS